VLDWRSGSERGHLSRGLIAPRRRGPSNSRLCENVSVPSWSKHTKVDPRPVSTHPQVRTRPRNDCSAGEGLGALSHLVRPGRKPVTGAEPPDESLVVVVALRISRPLPMGSLLRAPHAATHRFATGASLAGTAHRVTHATVCKTDRFAFFINAPSEKFAESAPIGLRACVEVQNKTIRSRVSANERYSGPGFRPCLTRVCPSPCDAS
jgi:hypothetical protein